MDSMNHTKPIELISHLEMSVHDSATVEIGLVKVHHAEFGGGGDVHERFLVLDLGISSMLLRTQSLRLVEFGVELLQPLLAESIEVVVVF